MKKLSALITLVLFTMHIYSQCTVTINAPQQFICNGTTITLQASPGFSSYLWSNGTTGATLVVNRPGTYTVKATTTSNCIAYASKVITGPKKISFTVNGNKKCDTSTYLFVNETNLQTSNISQFKWLFGDGSSYTSSNPIQPSDAVMWTNFNKSYTANGVFIPKLVVWYNNPNCIDTIPLDTSNLDGKRAPSNWITNVSIILNQNPPSLQQESSVCIGTSVTLRNQFDFPKDILGFSYVWNFADPNANPAFSDYFMDQPAPTYQYKGGAFAFPRLTINCPDQPAKTIYWYSKIDSISAAGVTTMSSPALYTNMGFRFEPNQWMNASRFVYRNGIKVDSLPAHWTFFGSNPIDTLKKVKPADLFGYGLKVSGAKASIENYLANVSIRQLQKCQIEGNFPVEFTNATNNAGGGALFNKWNFDDKFSPACTSFSIPNTSNGQPPYISAVDFINRTQQRFKFKGQVYLGRANCNHSIDTLPIHQYQTYTTLLRWHRSGIDFPPFDMSATGWTTNLAEVSPGGKKYVHPLDQATWGTPRFAIGDNGARIDTMIGLFPSDLQPNTPIVLKQDIPDPVAAYKGFHGYMIPAGTSVDTAGLLNPPLAGVLPDGTIRANYRGNTPLPVTSLFKDLYEYFFNRTIPSAYKVTLSISGNEICATKDSVLIISGKPDVCGIKFERESNAGLYGATKIDLSNTWPPSSLRTFILLNYDSLLDRNDMTPCALDGFVQFDGTHPISGAVTPGGNVFPAFNLNYNFNPLTAWVSQGQTIIKTHYIPQGVSPYTLMPFDQKKGKVSIGFIIGAGCNNVGCTGPSTITDTLWYNHALDFTPTDLSFNLSKQSGSSIYGKNGFLAGQDSTIGRIYNNNEPNQWSRLYGIGDVFVPKLNKTLPLGTRFTAIHWGDGSIEVDSFTYNQQDTPVVFQNTTYLAPKGSFAYQRTHYTYELVKGTLALKHMQTFPLGAGRFIVQDFDTTYFCYDIMKALPPASIRPGIKIIDPSINLNHLAHQYSIKSANNPLSNNDVYQVTLAGALQNGDNFMATKHVTIGYYSSFKPQVNKSSYQVNEPIKFIDSILYFNPNTNNSPFGPNRPLVNNQPVLHPQHLFRLRMLNYPLDTIHIYPNQTKPILASGTSCPSGYVFRAGSPNVCLKIDTFFFERIYWDYESDGVIDYAGSNPTKMYDKPGTYVVSMISRDSVGYYDTVRHTIVVQNCLPFNPLPNKLASCNDSSIYLSVDTSFAINSWYMVGNSNPISQNTLFLPFSQDGKYYVVANQAQSNCQYIDTVQLVFMNKVKIKQGNAITLCSKGSDTLTLEPTVTSGYQFKWDDLIAQSKLKITQSEGLKWHTLKISKDGIDCFDSTLTAFVEPIKTNRPFQNYCVKDTFELNILSNIPFDTLLDIRWKLNSSDAYSKGGFKNNLIYPSNGTYNSAIKQSFGICSDSLSFGIFADPSFVELKIVGSSSVKLNDTSSYSVALATGYTYSWNVSGGTVLSGLGSNQIKVHWNQTGASGVVKVNRVGGTCTDLDSMLISINSTGLVRHSSLSNIRLFPNPSNGHLTFYAEPKTNDPYSYQLMDIEGRMIEKGELTPNGAILEKVWDVTTLNPGLYFLIVSGQNESITYKWIKQ
jgi:hypothetical protein